MNKIPPPPPTVKPSPKFIVAVHKGGGSDWELVVPDALYMFDSEREARLLEEEINDLTGGEDNDWYVTVSEIDIVPNPLEHFKTEVYDEYEDD